MRTFAKHLTTLNLTFANMRTFAKHLPACKTSPGRSENFRNTPLVMQNLAKVRKLGSNWTFALAKHLLSLQNIYRPLIFLSLYSRIRGRGSSVKISRLARISSFGGSR